ncbi:hypothetical protein D5F01_LYC01474 [Larimichthys crocea]|uniref:Uncharacterized protein n=1 Tax=Larimichthys crocea TaxID=215358 RepID=A0A6G0J5N7_LARCR|nr:hypothetical protein D5F01_LYC01474 [Larimichthys crocea]
MNPADMENVKQGMAAQAAVLCQHEKHLTAMGVALQEASARHNQHLEILNNQLQQLMQLRQTPAASPPTSPPVPTAPGPEPRLSALERFSGAPGRAPRTVTPRPGRSAPGAGKIRSRRGDRGVQQRRCVTPSPIPRQLGKPRVPLPNPSTTNTIRGRGKAREMGDPVRTIHPPLRGEGRTSRDRALPSQVPQEKEGTRPAVLPLPPGTPKTPILSQKTCLQLNPRVPPGERPGPAPTERCLPERARRRRKGSAMPKHHFPRTSKTPMLKSKMPPTEQKGNGTAEASAFPVHSREGVTRASRDRALPPWPLQASRLG